MKKLSLYVFLGLMFCNVGFAENKVLECLLWDHYYNEKVRVWSNIPRGMPNKYKLKIEDDNLNIYDYSLETYHRVPYEIIYQTEDSIVALNVTYVLDESVTTIHYSKKNGHVVEMSSSNEEMVISMSEGYCK